MEHPGLVLGATPSSIHPSYGKQEGFLCLPCQSVQPGSSLSQNACSSPCFGLGLILPSPFMPVFRVVLAARIRQLKAVHGYNPRFILKGSFLQCRGTGTDPRQEPILFEAQLITLIA